MSKTTETEVAAADVALPEKYTELRSKIVDGSIAKTEAQELYDAFQKITPGENRATAVKKLCDDVYKDAGPDKFHTFVKQLAEVEKDVLNKQYPIPEKATPERTKQIQNAKGAEFYRNTSLARNVMVYECVQEGLGKGTYEALKVDNLKEAASTLNEIQIPDKVKDTYKIVNDFFKENKIERGAAINLTFHALYGTIRQYSSNEGNDIGRNSDEQKVIEGKLIHDVNQVAKNGVFFKNTTGSLDLVIAQLEGKAPTAEQIENSKNILKEVQKKVELIVPTPLTGHDNAIKTPASSVNKDSSPPVTKSPSFFDKVKAFVKEAQGIIKETVYKVLDNVVPGRRKMNEMINEVMNNPEPTLKSQASDLPKASKEVEPKVTKGVESEAKSKTWQKAISPALKVEAPTQTPAVKLSQHRKGMEGRGS